MKPAGRRRSWAAALSIAWAAAALSSGVAASVPSGDVRPDAAPLPPSIYLGWRIYQGHCARCHGPAAEGSDSAPDLLPRVRGMSEARFAATVLQRYQWVVPRSEAAGEGAGRDALIQDILRRREGPLEMPLWEREPAVRANIDDLFLYLRGRANGSVDTGRPTGP